jgi:hypothetical protein
MASPSVTHTFVNSTTADATQVNTNFTDIINGLTDGSKDLSISALTCAGNFTANGTTNTLGSASNDDLIVNASLASTVLLKTTFTYDLGATTIGLRDVFFGDAGSAARSTKIRANTIAASTTFTLPTRTGTAEVVPTITASQTGTYAILTTDDFIPCNASGGGFTVTLPTAVSAAGKRYRIKSTHAQTTNVITIATTSSQTIDGVTTTTLNSQYEEVTVLSDGANWHIIEKQRTLALGTETWTDSETNCTTAVTITRSGDRVFVDGTCSITGTFSGSEFNITIPATYTASSAYDISAALFGHTLGSAYFVDNSTATAVGSVSLTSTTNLRLFVEVASGTYVGFANVAAAVPFAAWASGDRIKFNACWQVSGWKG